MSLPINQYLLRFTEFFRVFLINAIDLQWPQSFFEAIGVWNYAIGKKWQIKKKIW